MVLLESLKIPLGTLAPDFRLSGADGREYSLENFRSAKILVVVFMCNHCPYVQAVWQRLVDLSKKFAARGVQFVGINSNVGSPGYEDEENLKVMKEYAAKYSMDFPYLADERQEAAKVYEAQCTPDIYVFDGLRKLAYHGRVDDSWKNPAGVQKQELAEALEAILTSRPVQAQQHPSMGCSIKWK